MKLGYCLSAFVFGCLLTVYMRSVPAQGNVAAETQVSTQSDQATTQEPQGSMTVPEVAVETAPFGSTESGQEVTKFSCTNSNGYSFDIIDYGATIIAMRAPDKEGLVENITLSCSDMEAYEACTSYFGCTVGRYCNRIAKGKFSIDGTEYTLATNNGDNHLHGGKVGFDKKIWAAEPMLDDSSAGVRFTLTSEDGDEGFPGNVEAVVEYSLNDDNELIVDYKASTDKPTHVNLTNHCYWNLAGAGSGDVMKQHLQLECDKYVEVNEDAIPTGNLPEVAGSIFDFNTMHAIGEKLEGTEEPGYDHCWVVRDYKAAEAELSDEHLVLAATAKDPESGRKMTVKTTMPGIQFYTGNFLDGQPGSGGFEKHGAFCLETQFYPDAPNQKDFPSSLLKPDAKYHHRTVHQFSVE
jgi:aldose 1-epimerase